MRSECIRLVELFLDSSHKLSAKYCIIQSMEYQVSAGLLCLCNMNTTLSNCMQMGILSMCLQMCVCMYVCLCVCVHDCGFILHGVVSGLVNTHSVSMQHTLVGCASMTCQLSLSTKWSRYF